MRVDVWLDLVCPWCYLGKRRLEKALSGFPHNAQVRVGYRSFELDPAAPRGAAVRQTDMLVGKYGMPAEQAVATQRRLEELAAADGLEYHLTEGLTGNSFDAHRLLHLAAERGVADAVAERFFRAQFTEVRSLFDTESLVGLAAEAGLDPAEAAGVLAGDAYADAVRADSAQAHDLGVTGVPFVVVGERYAVAGAQPVEVFGEALRRAWAQPSES
jgi:predicted DsbA family dithiol-disulfide isomerase